MGLASLGPLCAHHSSSHVVTRCQLSGAVVSQCLRGGCPFSSAAQLLYGPWRGLTRLCLQSCTFGLHLEKLRQDEERHREGSTLLGPARCCGKARQLWQKCLQADGDLTLCSSYEELDYISADNIPDLTGVLY